MAGKITELSAINAATINFPDVFEVVDVSDTSMAPSGTNKKLAFSDLLISMGVPRMGCALTQSGHLINTGAVTNLNWDGEVSDPDGMHAAGSSDIFVPASGAGVWAVTATVQGPASANNSDVAIAINGSLKPNYIPAGKTQITNTVVMGMGAGTLIQVVIYNSHVSNSFFSGSIDVTRIAL